MKHIIKCLGSLLAVVLLTAAFTACSDDDLNGSANVGLGIKVFFPTKVVTNQPITINGSFNVLPRTNDWHFINWHPLSLTIHQPIYPIGEGATNIASTMTDSYSAVMGDLVPEYQGFVENPDQ